MQGDYQRGCSSRQDKEVLRRYRKTCAMSYGMSEIIKGKTVFG